MKSITTFDVILVSFPFSDLKGVKKRPALVLRAYSVKGIGAFCLIAMITSQVDGAIFPNDVSLVDIESAGLPKASLVRLAKIVTIEDEIVSKKIGSLGSKDQRNITKSLNDFLKDIL